MCIWWCRGKSKQDWKLWWPPNCLSTFTPDFSLNTGHLARRTFKQGLQQCLYLIIIIAILSLNFQFMSCVKHNLIIRHHNRAPQWDQNFTWGTEKGDDFQWLGPKLWHRGYEEQGGAGKKWNGIKRGLDQTVCLTCTYLYIYTYICQLLVCYILLIMLVYLKNLWK